ncbi:MAG: hypothetical protein IJ740_09615 [Ruminococcus sp.]|nr:hypothetical protein [Ruminococcus sp.]
MKEKAYIVSLCGVTSAVALLIMFLSGVLPMLDYALPMYAGFTMVIIIQEAGTKWAIMTYCSVSILCIFLTPNYQASVLFIMFMGYYPILRCGLERIPAKALKWIVKYAVFNIAIVAYYNIFKKLFTGVETDDLGFLKYSIYFTWAGANVLFLLYDYLIAGLTDVYTNWFRKKIISRK